MANNTVYPYGTDGQLPASIGVINDLSTGGADKALSAEMGKVLGQQQQDSLDVLDDLEITDGHENILARFRDGNIETKNFDSSRIPLTSVPDYWRDYLDTKLASLRSDYLDLERYGVAFIFVTDTHWEDNEKKSPAVIKYIQDKAGIEMCVFGGDVVTDHGTRVVKLEEIRDFADAMDATKAIFLVGNHDYNTSDQPSASWDANKISPGEFYRLCNVPEENVVHYDGTEVENKYDEYYGYLDNESQKVRYIFLDSGAVHIPNWADTNLRISDAQVDWMKARITELPTGWGVILFTHIFFQNYSGTVHGIGTQIETALDSIYDTANAKIICVVCGHVHASQSKVSAKGYPIIATTTDSAGQTNHEGLTYVPGTDTEQAFDIFFVNTLDATIEVVRIGAGDTDEDRSFTF